MADVVMYATPADLASYLKQDVDTSTATLALQIASELFAKAAGTRFEPTTVTYQTQGSASSELILPFWPITSVTAARIGGVTVTDFSRIGQIMYRVARWGGSVYPPPLVEVDLTHGYTTAPDDVKGAVVETAGAAYMSPDITTKSESIDDYSVSTMPNSGGVMLSPAAEKLARYYAGAFVA
ncbi:MAG TPA: hypothetical protein VL652_45165 [Kutzneria sp.]|nr:hypothetical protein [Kutzneria sp.]